MSAALRNRKPAIGAAGMMPTIGINPANVAADALQAGHKPDMRSAPA